MIKFVRLSTCRSCRSLVASVDIVSVVVIVAVLVYKVTAAGTRAFIFVAPFLLQVPR